MHLADLLRQVDVLDVSHPDPSSVDVRSVTRDSRNAGPGVVFVAIRGSRVDGHAFVEHVQGGVVVVEQDGLTVQPGVVRVRVADTRVALARIAAALHRRPARSVPVVGITGTNGKTTVAGLGEGALTALGRRGGRIGTLGAAWWDEERATGLTTPEAPELQGLLAEMRQDAVEAAFVEVSSIALEQRRAEALPFHTVVFTNLSRDHLDFHGTMEAYAAAKALLFQPERLRPAGGAPRAILCGDDPAWRAMQPPQDRWLYGFQDHNDVRIERLDLTAEGQQLWVRVPGQDAPVEVRTRLVGSFNALNVVAGLCALHTVGLSWEEAAAGLAEVPGVPGRLQRVPRPPGAVPAVFVDYAHTPDALRSALEALRPLVGEGRPLVVVFGCGGDRDVGKRPEMGAVAAELADRVVLTSDNPRSEDPDAILEQVLRGVPEASLGRLWVLPDRRVAIRRGVELGGEGGVVLVAGKGHEATQTIGRQVLPFDDVQVAAQALVDAADAAETGPAAPVERLTRVLLRKGTGPWGQRLDTEALAAATRGEILRSGPVDEAGRPVLGGVLTDTRKDLRGSWFLALKGSNFDGHAYLRQARDKGALGAIVSHLPDGFDPSAWDRGLVRVADTTVALQDLGRFVRHAFAGPVVGVAGSSGKTTTRALITCALSPGGAVHQTAGNLNNHLGVPMSLLAAPPEARALVLELGTNSPGEIAFLAGIARPSIRLVVNVAHEHLDGLGGIEGVAAEERALFDTAGPGDTLIVNADDPWLRDVQPGPDQRAVRFGRAADADVRLLDVHLDANALSTTARIATPRGEVTAMIPAFGAHFAHNATAALACALAAGVAPDRAAAALADYAPVGLRQRVEHLDSGTLVLNDAYNANPLSVRAALATLVGLGGRGVAALGDMLELGDEEAALHREILEHATSLGLERVVVVGPRFAAAAQGLPVETFEHAVAAGQALVGTLGPEHRLLVKGSRGLTMERILQPLQAER